MNHFLLFACFWEYRTKRPLFFFFFCTILTFHFIPSKFNDFRESLGRSTQNRSIWPISQLFSKGWAHKIWSFRPIFQIFRKGSDKNWSFWPVSQFCSIWWFSEFFQTVSSPNTGDFPNISWFWNNQNIFQLVILKLSGLILWFSQLSNRSTCIRSNGTRRYLTGAS